MKFILNDHDKQETDRLLHIAEDVEAGKLAKDDVGEDGEKRSRYCLECTPLF